MTIRNLPILVRMMAFSMAILVAAPASGLGALLYFCTMTGEVGPKCCCDHEAEAHPPADGSLSAAPCCVVVGADQALQPARIEIVTLEFETTQLVTLPWPQSSRQLVRKPTDLGLAHASGGPPPDTGPPLFIQYCSYLI